MGIDIIIIHDHIYVAIDVDIGLAGSTRHTLSIGNGHTFTFG